MTSEDPREIAVIAPELFVPDVGEAIRFYTDKLGFQLYRVDPPGHHNEQSQFAIVTLGNAVVMFAIDALYIGMGGRIAEERGSAIDIRIMVSDVNAMYERCRQHGVAVVHDLADRYYGLRDFVIADLNGFRLRFASPRG